MQGAYRRYEAFYGFFSCALSRALSKLVIKVRPVTNQSLDDAVLRPAETASKVPIVYPNWRLIIYYPFRRHYRNEGPSGDQPPGYLYCVINALFHYFIDARPR